MAIDSDARNHDLMIAVFSVSAGLVGVCLTGIGLMRVVTSVRHVASIGDDLLALDAVLFVAACLFAFVALRRGHSRFQVRMRQCADATFLVALVLMAAVCTVITYSVI